MSAAPVSRAVIRQHRLLIRRNNFRQASTTAETATKMKEQATASVSKASEGLSRVSGSAGSAVSRAGSGAMGALGRIGGRTGRLISFVQSMIPPTVYYSRVGMELSRLVFQGQKMAPPSLSQFQGYFQPITNAVRNPRSIMSSTSSVANSIGSPESILSSIRNVNRQQLITVGVIGAEILGFFTVGTMIGRMKVVGYRGQAHHDH